MTRTAGGDEAAAVRCLDVSAARRTRWSESCSVDRLARRDSLGFRPACGQILELGKGCQLGVDGSLVCWLAPWPQLATFVRRWDVRFCRLDGEPVVDCPDRAVRDPGGLGDLSHWQS